MTLNWKFCPRKYRLLILACLSAIALVMTMTFSPVARAKLFDGPVDKLPTPERVSLREGEVTLLGKEGNYTCRILAKSSVEAAWKVLTDYEHFEQFLPGVASSELLESNGNNRVFEQINKIKTLIFSIESRIKIASIESYPQTITFKAIEGDIKTLNGKWTLEPVSDYPSAPPDKVLITHQVRVKPAKTPSDSIFYGIYEDRLKETLAAIKQETEKRFIQAQK